MTQETIVLSEEDLKAVDQATEFLKTAETAKAGELMKPIVERAIEEGKGLPVEAEAVLSGIGILELAKVGISPEEIEGMSPEEVVKFFEKKKREGQDKWDAE